MQGLKQDLYLKQSRVHIYHFSFFKYLKNVPEIEIEPENQMFSRKMTRLLPFHPIYGGRWFLRRATYSTAKVDYIFAPTRAKLRHFANISGKCCDFEQNIKIEHKLNPSKRQFNEFQNH